MRPDDDDPTDEPGDTSEQDARDGEFRRQLALAEFNALRAEIVARTNIQATSTALGVTAIGLVAGFVITDDADFGVRLLLILPFLVAAAGIHASEQGRMILLIGTYIRDELWPYLSGDSEKREASRQVPSWERVVGDFWHPEEHPRTAMYWTALLQAWLPSLLIFACGSAAPLIILEASDGALSGAYRAVWWLGLVLAVSQLLLARSAVRVRRPLAETLRRDRGGRH